jgi:capsular exopolysaccharide synthesis family protein
MHCQTLNWDSNSGENTFSNPKIGPHAAEQFRTLRSRLYQMRDNRPLRKILVTSALTAEGKTFVSYNLAHAFVRQPDRRVLLIDADLRRSQMHFLLGAPYSPGLTDYLAGNADELQIIQNGRMPNSRSESENFFFIPGGNPIANPSELLMNGRLKTLFDRLSPIFDWVIVDSAPCLPVADANVVGQFCDGVLLVILGASTPGGTAQRAIQELRGRNVLGVVLNAVENASSYGASYYAQTSEAEALKSGVQ